MDTPAPIIPTSETPAPENLTENSNTKKIAIGVAVTVVAVIAVAALFGGQLFKGSFIADDLKKGLKSADFSLTVTRPLSVDDFKGTALFSGHQTLNFSDTSFGNFSGSFKLTGTRSASGALVQAVMSNPEHKKFFDLVSPDAIKNTFEAFSVNTETLKSDLTNSISNSTLSINDPQTDDTTKKALQVDIDSLNLIANNLPKALAAMQQLYDFIQTLKDGAKDLPATIQSLKILTSNFKIYFDELKQASMLISDKNSLSSFQPYLDFTSTLSTLINSEKALSALEAAAGAPVLSESFHGSFSPPKDANGSAQVNIIEHNVNTFEEIEKTVITLENKSGAQESITTTLGSAKGLPAPELFTADALQKFYKGASLGSTALSYRSIFTDIASQLIGSDTANVCKGPFSLNVQGILFDSCTFDAEGGVLKNIFLTGKGPGDSVYDLKITEPTYVAAAAGSGTGLDIAVIDPNHHIIVPSTFTTDDDNQLQGLLQIPASFMLKGAADGALPLINRTLSIQKKDGSWEDVDTKQDIVGNMLFCIPNTDPTCNESKVSTQGSFSYDIKSFTSKFDSDHAFKDSNGAPEYHFKLKIAFSDAATNKEADITNNEKFIDVRQNYFVAGKQNQGDLSFSKSTSFLVVPFYAGLPALEKTSVPLSINLDSDTNPVYTAELTLGKNSSVLPHIIELPPEVTSKIVAKVAVPGKHSLRMTINEGANGKVTDFVDDNFADFNLGQSSFNGLNVFTKVPYIGSGGIDQVVLPGFDPTKTNPLVLTIADAKGVIPRPTFKGTSDKSAVCVGIKIAHPTTGAEILYNRYNDDTNVLESVSMPDKTTGTTFSSFSIPYSPDLAANLSTSNGHFDLIFNDACPKDGNPFIKEDNLTDNVQHYYLPVESSKNVKTDLNGIKIDAAGGGSSVITVAKLGVKDYKIATDPKTGLITVSYVIMNKDENQKNIISDIYKKGGAIMAMYTEPNNVKGVTEFAYEAMFLPFEIKDGETITINARNSNNEALQSIELVYSKAPPLAVETKSLPDAVVGAAYSQKLSASGGKAPYKWKYNALLSKNFPAGMKLDEDGTLSGTPTTEGEYVFHMTLSDSLKDGPNFLMSLKVAAKPAVVVNNPPSGGGGGSYSGGSGGGGGGGSSPSITPKKEPVKTFTFSFKTSPLAKHKDLKGYTLLSHVSILVNAGVMSGYNTELFGPNDRLTRAQFLKMVVNSFKLPLPKEIAHNPCKDVARKAWHAPYFSTAKSLKIISGFGDGSCLPDEPITRAEATKILFNAIAHIDGKTQTAVVAAVGATDVNPFKDVSSKNPFYKYVVSAQKYGFITGFGKDIFDPNGTLTRGQGAKIIVNALNKLAVR